MSFLFRQAGTGPFLTSNFWHPMCISGSYKLHVSDTLSRLILLYYTKSMPTIFLPILWEETSVVICDLRSSILHAWILMAFDDTSSPGLRLLAPRPRRRRLGRRSLRLASALAHTTTRHLEVHPGSPEPKPFGMTPLLVPTTSTKASYTVYRYKYR